MKKLLAQLVGGQAVNIVDGFANAIDRFVETPEERKAGELLKMKAAQRPGELQVELNKIEASHRTVFVAGWRPFIGWACGVSLGLYFIPQYIMASYLWTVSVLDAGELVAYPVGSDGLMELVFALLGMGALRGIDKWAGRAK